MTLQNDNLLWTFIFSSTKKSQKNPKTFQFLNKFLWKGINVLESFNFIQNHLLLGIPKFIYGNIWTNIFFISSIIRADPGSNYSSDYLGFTAFYNIQVAETKSKINIVENHREYLRKSYRRAFYITDNWLLYTIWLTACAWICYCNV